MHFKTTDFIGGIFYILTKIILRNLDRSPKSSLLNTKCSSFTNKFEDSYQGTIGGNIEDQQTFGQI